MKNKAIVGCCGEFPFYGCIFTKEKLSEDKKEIAENSILRILYNS